MELRSQMVQLPVLVPLAPFEVNHLPPYLPGALPRHIGSCLNVEGGPWRTSVGGHTPGVLGHPQFCRVTKTAAG